MINSEGDKAYIRIPPCDLESVEDNRSKGNFYINKGDLIAWIRGAALKTTDPGASMGFELLADEIEKLRKQ